jgi:hypothetical protein
VFCHSAVLSHNDVFCHSAVLSHNDVFCLCAVLSHISSGTFQHSTVSTHDGCPISDTSQCVPSWPHSIAVACRLVGQNRDSLIFNTACLPPSALAAFHLATGLPLFNTLTCSVSLIFHQWRYHPLHHHWRYLPPHLFVVTHVSYQHSCH